MAAFLPPRNRNDMSYREDNGGGGVGKVRKNTFGRATRTKPYDRPPTSIRNPNTLSSNASGGDNNGWLSKLVDPAQRLITASAHKLFSSVFRKRLPPPPLQPPEPEANERTRDERRQADPTDHVNTQGAAVDGFDISSGSSDRGGITDLEQMFKQKTFTRSEIDRLTALLQSKSIDMSVGHEERRSEVIPSTAVRFQDRKGEFLNTPVKDSRIGTNLISTPIVSEDVLDEDVASPAELAKAYMGSRPSKVSPSVLGLRSQPPRENSSMPMNSSSLKSAIVPAFPRPSGRPGFIENGFLTPRSLSRSAIHSLARASQSRFHSPTTFQGPGQAIESVGGSTPASQIAWENNRSGSKQGSLKRRSSVLDNDIGSSDGIRRIRQKYNLLPGSGSLPIRRTGLASDATKHPSSTAKTHLEGEPSTVNGGNSFHGSGFTPVPTKSSEMASKIFQQLDALVKTSKEKSPAKLSPSMLRGSALKSLENVDSSMFMDNVPDNNLDVRRDASLSDAMDSALQKHGQSEENGPPNSIAYYDKPILEVGDKDAKSLVKNSLSNDKTTAMSTVNSALHPPAQKKRAFRMTAHEDFLDLDDDDYSNGNENTLAGGSEKLDPALAESKTSGAGPVTVENPPASTKVNPPSDSIWEQKTETLTFSKKPSPIATLAGTENKSTTVSDKDDSPKKSNDGVPISVLEDKLVSRKEPNGISPTFSFGAKMGNEAPQMISSSSRVEDSSRINFSASSDSKPGNSSSISVAFGATESPLTAGPESQKRDSKNNLKADAFRLPETVPSAVSTPSPSIFQFGSSSSLNNGSVTPPFLSAAPPAATDSAKTTSTGNTTANNFSPASSTPSFVAATISSMFPSTSASPPSATAAVGLTEAKTKETSFGNLTGSSFGGTSSGMGAFGGNHFGASMSAVSNIFGGSTGTSSSSASTVSNIFGGTSDPSSTSASTVSNIFGGTSGPSSTSASTVSNIFSGTSGPSSTSAGTGTNFFGSTSAMTNSDSSLFGTSSAMTTAGSSVFGGTTMSSESNIFGGTGSSNFGGTSSSVVSTGSGIFSFNTGTASSAASNQPQAFNPFSNGSAPALTAGSVSATSTQSIPIQFGSSASAPSSGLTGNTAFSSSSPFFGLTPSTPSSEASALSSSSNNTSSVFGSSWQTPKSPVPNSTTSALSVFAFGGSSASTTTSNTTPMFFGSSASNSSASFPPFSTPAVATPSQPVFGNSSPAFPFGNNGQMSMEESMAEDTVQTSTPSAPVFNQQPMSSSFVFGASSTPAGGNQFGATPPAANPFQFGGQPNIATPQNASPFQASGSLDFNAGGSFSLGASGGGGDKSNRRIVKVRRAPRKK